MCAKAIKTPIPQTGLGAYHIGREEIDAVTRVLQSPEKLFRFRGDEKTECDLFEAESIAYTGAKHALIVNSGTAALTCCLAGMRIGPGDEVIVPGYTYIATASAVIDVGAVPVIVDIDESLGLSPAAVEKAITPYTKAIIAVHMQGVPCKLNELRAIAKKHGIKIIEDACQAIGARYFGKLCGVDSDAFAWSTNFYKVITSGEGGVFFTSDPDIFQYGLYQSDPAMTMWSTNFGFEKELKPYIRAGYRSSELSAAILRVQLKRIEPMLYAVRANAKLLRDSLNKPLHYQLQHIDDPDGACNHSFGFIFHTKEFAQKFVEQAAEAGLPLASSYTGFPDRHLYIHWDPILEKTGATSAGYPWKDPAYKGSVQYHREMCPGVLDILPRTVKLTIHPEMTEQNMLEISACINELDACL